MDHQRRCTAMFLAILIVAISAAPSSHAAQPSVIPYRACFESAGRYYGISPVLLEAIALKESRMNPLAIDHDADGSYDIGIMQINSSHLAELARLGYPPQVLWTPCANIAAGAWVLANNMRRMGVTWSAVGAYNSSDPRIGARYAYGVARYVMALER